MSDEEKKRGISGRTVAKVAFGAVCAGILCAGGTWLSGAAFVAMNKQFSKVSQVRLESLPYYWQRYGDGHDPVRKDRLVKATTGGYGSLALLPAAIVVSRMRRRQKLFGDARFADEAEIRAANLLTGEGIIVGKWKDQFLTLPGQQYVWVAAPPRSGKGRGIAITNLLNWADSCIVFDVKGELFDATSGIRAAYGQKVFRFAPFDPEFKTCRYNPLGYVSTDPLKRVSELREIARMFYSTDSTKTSGDSGNFFADQATDLFMGLGLYLLETPEMPRTFGQMLRLASGAGKPLQQVLADLINDRVKAKRPLSHECTDALNRVLVTPSNTFGGIKSTFTGPLTIFADPKVDAATSGNDFDLRYVRRDLMSIFLCIPQRNIADAQVLTKLLYTQAINLNTDKLPEQDETLQYQCLCVLDEFIVAGRLDVLAQTMGLLPGYNMRVLIICQSDAQVAGLYGKDTAQAMRTAAALQVLFAPKEQSDAEAYSKMLGHYTAENVSRSHGTSHGRGGGGSNNGTSEGQASRPLMYPQELKLLGRHNQIIVLEGHRPILCQKSYWDKNPTLAARKLPAVKVPPLDVDGHYARSNGQVRDVRPDEGVRELIPAERLVLDKAPLPPLQASASAEERAHFVNGFWGAMGGEPLDGDEPAAPPKKARTPRAKKPTEQAQDSKAKGKQAAPASKDDANYAAAEGSPWDDELPPDFFPPADDHGRHNGPGLDRH